MKRFLTGITLLVIFLVAGCSKRGKEPTDTLAIEGLKYIQLRNGQYFIYKDSATLKLDSIVVTESRLEMLHTPPGYMWGQSSYENYKLTLSKIDSAGTSTWLSGNATAAYSSTNFGMLSATTNTYDQYMFRYPLATYHSIFPGDSSIASMVVEGKTYNNVLKITGNTTGGSVFYWSAGVGLIRYQRGGTLPKTYTLLRKN